MKHCYLRLKITAVCLSMMLIHASSNAQCPWGYVPSGTAFDTTIATPAGINTLEIKFPKFDPQNGMVVCVRLCITITGVVDYVSVENNSGSPQTANIYYIRTDELTGPALSTPLSNSVNHHYGPYALGGTNGVPNSGPDFLSIANDTVLNAVSVCRTITDTADLSQFYGSDSVTYNYNITALTTATVSGGSNSSSILTSAFVRFRFEYCYCPAWLLPINITKFDVNKLQNDKAELNWSGFDDPNKNYKYVVEMSRNGRNFTNIGSVNKNQVADHNNYKFTYSTGNNPAGIYYFRIKQVYSNGYTRFSEVKSMTLESSGLPKFNLYPNPSNGIVGIKFDNNQSGKYLVLITNAQGQTVMKKEIEVSGPSYRQIATLQSGMYWLRLTDVTSHLSCVNQLFIK